jgi:hypothetical protein
LKLFYLSADHAPFASLKIAVEGVMGVLSKSRDRISLVGCKRLVVGPETSEVLFLRSGHPSPVARHVHALRESIVGILLMRDVPQILPSVVESIAVDVVNVSRWPLTRHVKPRQAVGEIAA